LNRAQGPNRVREPSSPLAPIKASDRPKEASARAKNDLVGRRAKNVRAAIRAVAIPRGRNLAAMIASLVPPGMNSELTKPALASFARQTNL
jgi:hypothetical protein